MIPTKKRMANTAKDLERQMQRIDSCGIQCKRKSECIIQPSVLVVQTLPQHVQNRDRYINPKE